MAPAHRRRRILIVDDESGIRKLLSVYFTSAGFAVQTAENGAEALAIACQEPFDVVLSDVRDAGRDQRS